MLVVESKREKQARLFAADCLHICAPPPCTGPAQRGRPRVGRVGAAYSIRGAPLCS